MSPCRHDGIPVVRYQEITFQQAHSPWLWERQVGKRTTTMRGLVCLWNLRELCGRPWHGRTGTGLLTCWVQHDLNTIPMIRVGFSPCALPSFCWLTWHIVERRERHEQRSQRLAEFHESLQVKVGEKAEGRSIVGGCFHCTQHRSQHPHALVLLLGRKHGCSDPRHLPRLQPTNHPLTSTICTLQAFKPQSFGFKSCRNQIVCRENATKRRQSHQIDLGCDAGCLTNAANR